jgi:hypothetical protein
MANKLAKDGWDDDDGESIFRKYCAELNGLKKKKGKMCRK